jgi:hypothetical protein
MINSTVVAAYFPIPRNVAMTSFQVALYLRVELAHVIGQSQLACGQAVPTSLPAADLRQDGAASAD